MWNNYIKIAWRNVVRHKVYSAINVAGLAFGMACCIFIFLYLQDELSYDRYHEHADRIVRVSEDLQINGGLQRRALTSAPMGPALVEEVPDVEAMARFSRAGGVFERGDRRFQNDNMFFVDSTVFDVFSFDLLSGDPKTALVAPYTIVLTQSTAKKYFGDENPVGQTMMHEDGSTFVVTGVVANVPHNSHFTFDGLISFTTLESFSEDMDAWYWNNFYTYLLLRKNYDSDRVTTDVDAMLRRHDVSAKQVDVGYVGLPLTPLIDIHLRSHLLWEIEANGHLQYLYVFGLVAVFILLIACVNFTNLATARSAERAREVGLRKVVGAGRTELAVQFLAESLFMAFLAMGVALILCKMMMPAFNDLAGKAIPFGSLLRTVNVAALVAIVGIVALVAGGYPALVLAGFRPSIVLKGVFRTSSRGTFLRKGLVVFQFAMTIALIVGTTVVTRQLNFLQRQDLGFTDEQMLVVDYEFGEDVQQGAETMKQVLEANPAVVSASISGSIPGAEPFSWYTVVDAAPGDRRETTLNYYPSDLDFIDTYGLHVIAGRDFSRDFPADTSSSLIINEATLSYFGWSNPEAALEKTFQINGKKLTVIGVVQNFNYRSLHDTVQPLGLLYYPAATRYFSLRLTTDHIRQTMAEIEQQWKSLVPRRPFDAFFLDDYYNRQYQADVHFGDLFRAFAGLAMLIACLGLFGLASFTAQQRTKEIGVRKVLGASVAQIAVLLSNEFVRLVLVALVVAAPVAYLAMNSWLSGFAYRTGVSWWIFALAGGLALLVALATVSVQTIRAALADPVRSLRYE